MRFAALDIDRRQAAPEGGDWLHESADHHVLAVGDAPFQAAGSVSGPVVVPVRIKINRIVHLGAAAAGAGNPVTDGNSLDGMDRKDGLPDPAVELFRPLN